MPTALRTSTTTAVRPLRAQSSLPWQKAGSACDEKGLLTNRLDECAKLMKAHASLQPVCVPFRCQPVLSLRDAQHLGSKSLTLISKWFGLYVPFQACSRAGKCIQAPARL